jgi:hypothetical protein
MLLSSKAKQMSQTGNNQHLHISTETATTCNTCTHINTPVTAPHCEVNALQQGHTQTLWKPSMRHGKPQLARIQDPMTSSAQVAVQHASSVNTCMTCAACAARLVATSSNNTIVLQTFKPDIASRMQSAVNATGLSNNPHTQEHQGLT